MFSLEGTPADLRRNVLLQFRKHADVRDPRVLDVLLAKGEMELAETVNQWKQRSHLMALLDNEAPPPPPMRDAEEFFKRFLNGSLTSKDVWMDWSRRDQLATLRHVAADPEAGADRPISREELGKWARRWTAVGNGEQARPARLK